MRVAAFREIEEALPHSSFRIRMLQEDDQGFDYAIGPKQPATGGCDILCVVEKIRRPAWADDIFKDQPAHPAKAFRRQPSPTGVQEPIKVFSSARPGASSILAMKLDHRGDFIMATDGFEALRRNFPDARLTLACGPWNVADAEAMGLFDWIVPFAIFPENASQGQQPFKMMLQAQQAFAQALGSETFDLAIDLRWDEDTRFLLDGAPARYRAGFGVREVFGYLDVAVAFRRETVEGRADQRLIGADRFSTPMLDHRGYAIVMSERWEAGPAFLVYGPYEALPAGDYRIDVLIEASEAPFTVAFDITADGSNTVLSIGEMQVTRADRVRLPVTLPSAVGDLEIRLKAWTQPVEPFRFMGCVIRHAGSLQGVHQREAMLALVSVATARIRSPYAETEAEGVT